MLLSDFCNRLTTRTPAESPNSRLRLTTATTLARATDACDSPADSVPASRPKPVTRVEYDRRSSRRVIDVTRPASARSLFQEPLAIRAAGDTVPRPRPEATTPRCFRPREQQRDRTSDTPCHPTAAIGVHRPRLLRQGPFTPPLVRGAAFQTRSVFHHRVPGEACALPCLGNLRPFDLQSPSMPFDPTHSRRNERARLAVTPLSSSLKSTWNRASLAGFCNSDDPRAQATDFPSSASFTGSPGFSLGRPSPTALRPPPKPSQAVQGQGQRFSRTDGLHQSDRSQPVNFTPTSSTWTPLVAHPGLPTWKVGNPTLQMRVFLRVRRSARPKTPCPLGPPHPHTREGERDPLHPKCLPLSNWSQGDPPRVLSSRHDNALTDERSTFSTARALAV
jgi:hypothetical protein